MTGPFHHRGIEEIDQVNSSRLHRLFEYWNTKRDDQVRPKWTDIELMEIHDIAPFIYVKDVVDDGQDFYYRYWGTNLAGTFGYEMSGKKASDHYTGAQLTMTIADHLDMLRAGKPLISTGQVRWAADKEYRNYTALVLPLDGDSAPLCHLMLGFDLEK